MGMGRWVGKGEGWGGGGGKRVKGGEGGRNVRRESGEGKIRWGGTGREKEERIKGVGVGRGEVLLRKKRGGTVTGVKEEGRGEGRGKGGRRERVDQDVHSTGRARLCG